MSHGRQSQLLVTALAGAAAAGGASAGCHPTGTPLVDPVLAGALAALVTVATSRSRRATWLVLAAAAVALARGWLYLPAVASLALAAASAWDRRQRRRVGALVGALAGQVVLRWPSVGFHGLTALVAAAAVGFCLVSAWRNLRSRSRRQALLVAAGLALAAVVLSAPAALGAVAARSHVDAAIADTSGALAAVGTGGAAAGAAKLDAAAAQLRLAASRDDRWWSAGARLVPVVAQQRQAVAEATSAAAALTSAAAAEAAKVDFHELHYSAGRFDLARIQAFRAPVEALATQTAAAQRTLRSVDSPWLIGALRRPLGTFSADLDRAAHSVLLADEAIRAAPGLLGGHGARQYFVAFMTPAEARGLDGLLGSYAELTIDDGRIALSRAGPFAQLNAALPAGGARLTGLADYVARYGRFHPERNFEDVTYSPDLPTVAKVISEMYPQAGGDHIDGVLALDPYGLASLLQFTGPVAVAGLPQPLTSANAADILVKQQYLIFEKGEATTRHDFLQEALRQAFTQLTHAALPGPATLSRALYPAAHDGRIMFWSFHTDEQPLLRSLHVDGSFPPNPGGEVLAVTTQNADNNKIDAYLSTAVHDEITYDPASGHLGSTVSVTLHNAAPPGGLPPYVLGSYPRSGIPTGTNRTWLTLYSTGHLRAATTGGAPLLVSAGAEAGVYAYSAYVDIPAGGTTVLRFDTTSAIAPDAAVSLEVVAQPAALPAREDIHFTPAPGWAVVGSARWDPYGGRTSSRVFRTART